MLLKIVWKANIDRGICINEDSTEVVRVDICMADESTEGELTYSRIITKDSSNIDIDICIAEDSKGVVHRYRNRYH